MFAKFSLLSHILQSKPMKLTAGIVGFGAYYLSKSYHLNQYSAISETFMNNTTRPEKKINGARTLHPKFIDTAIANEDGSYYIAYEIPHTIIDANNKLYPTIIDNISSKDRQDIKLQVKERKESDKRRPINGGPGIDEDAPPLEKRYMGEDGILLQAIAINTFKSIEDQTPNQRIAVSIYEHLSKDGAFEGEWMQVSVKMDDAQQIIESIVVNLYASEEELLRNTPCDEYMELGYYNCVGFEYIVLTSIH